MKKILLSSLFIAGLAVTFTGCLKDKGFENNEYGINDPDTAPPGVGFPFGSKAKSDFGLDFTASPQSVKGLVYVNLESGSPAKSDVNITLTNNTTSMVAAYNTANNLTGSAAVLALPTAIYSLPLSLKMPSGSRKVETEINVTNTTGLDPNRSYAVGLTITGVDGGYKIAENLKNLLIVFNLKNAYDGNYHTKGAAFHPSFGNYTWNTVGVFACGSGFSLATTGPNSVDLSPGQPLYNGGITYFSAVLPRFTVDPVTKKVTITSTNSTVFDAFPSYDSRYDPSTKTFYIKYGWSGSRIATDTFMYCGPR